MSTHLLYLIRCHCVHKAHNQSLFCVLRHALSVIRVVLG